MPTIICSVENRNIVGLRVRHARLAAKPRITQKELIARLQVLGIMIDQSGLSKIENGQQPVTDKEVVALAKALKVALIFLLQKPEAFGESERMRVRQYRQVKTILLTKMLAVGIY